MSQTLHFVHLQPVQGFLGFFKDLFYYYFFTDEAECSSSAGSFTCLSLCLVLTWQSSMAWNMLHGIWAGKPTYVSMKAFQIFVFHLCASSIKGSREKATGCLVVVFFGVLSYSVGWLQSLCDQADFGGERTFISHLSGFVCHSCLNTLLRLVSSPAATVNLWLNGFNGITDTTVTLN